jgi:hypothetical protein
MRIAAGRRSFNCVTASGTRTYLVECYAPGIEQRAVEAAAGRARAAAAELRSEGRHVAYVNSMLVCEDEVVFHLFAADGPAAVHDASVRAGVAFERVVETVALDPGASS